MDYENLIKLLNTLAQEYLFMDTKDVDIPMAGKLLNHLELIMDEAKKLKITPIRSCASSLTQILEKTILGGIDDKDTAASLLESGIHLMQEIADSYNNTGKYDGNIQEFLVKSSALAGVASVASVSNDSENQPDQIREAASENKPESSDKIEIQDESLTRDFIAEGLEYIEEIEINILNLENEPENKDYINAIFRPFHSIKGVASFLNLEKIRSLAHNLESLLDKTRNGEISVTPPLIDVVLDGADVLKTLIGQLRDVLEGKTEEPADLDIPALTTRIHRIEQGFDTEAGSKKIGDILVDDGIISKEKLEQTLKANASSPDKKIGQTLIEEGIVKPKQVSQALRKQVDQVTDLTTIRVDTNKLDDLIDMVGELVITQSMISQDLKNQVNADKRLTRDISQFFRITSALQRVSTSLRMIPIKQTFQRMSRLVRDLAKNAGKNVSVELVGEDTEIDRNMVDEIYNPLVHMIRNSVDHGLETTEDRIKAGKSEKGMITLKAYHRGGNIVIEIADDGKGLDKQKIINKAIKSGIIQTDENLSDQEIFKLIFMPGLSTAAKVTDVSGRGVGMDVVKRAVEKLRGKIEIESTIGEGTTFITRFPLTLAIIDGMIVKVGTESYILPTISIRQALRPTRASYTSVVGRGEMINAMGQLMPLIRMYDLFDIEPEHKEPWDAIVVVVDSESGSRCLMVDKIIGKAEVVVKGLGEGLKNIKGLAGGAILGNGRIGLIIDTEGLFELAQER
ncbi:MAG: chemotaxis protein CheA [Deltaproteobacteria bacterium HGW-Deltaproteobacteria-6]|jgi:two-component system chemotaxis sensor kinase CheA|nr:MAG: chemotaxis protein CheA [Deltaproteobacteria bacterium HGW-Deltaproteobacteria-6]